MPSSTRGVSGDGRMGVVEVKVDAVASGCVRKTLEQLSRMKRTRWGFILCRRENSPRSSHQSADKRKKWVPEHGPLVSSHMVMLCAMLSVRVQR
jgi:hypothetical protein